MKKIVAFALTCALLIGVAGCGKKDSFKKESDNLIKAAEQACGAQEASDKQKEAFLNDPDEEVSNTFENGAYFTLSSDDIKSFADESIYDVDEIKDMLCFMKYDGMTSCGSYVFGFKNTKSAEKYYKQMTSAWKSVEDSIVKMAEKNEDFSYAFSSEDNEFVLAELNGDDNDAMVLYYRLDGNTLTTIVYSGALNSDLYSELLDLFKEGDYCDLESLLK